MLFNRTRRPPPDKNRISTLDMSDRPRSPTRRRTGKSSRVAGQEWSTTLLTQSKAAVMGAIEY